MENSLDLADLVRMFEEAEEMSHSARAEAERARDYVDGNQLTAEEKAALKKRGQPETITNLIRERIEWMQGIEVKQRTDPKAFPREPQHEAGAEAATDALRFVADNTDWDRHRSAVWENMLIEGIGGVEVLHKQTKSGQVEIIVNQYPWDRLFYDPYSRRHDFSDARYLGAVVWQDFDELKRSSPKSAKAIDAFAAEESGQDTYDDKPQFGRWFDAKRKRVRVVLIWHRDGDVWRWCRFTKGAKLEGGDSPYVDEDGDSVCPLIMESAYVGRDNNRYGIIRDLFSLQDEVNKRTAKALHGLNTNQIIATRGMVPDKNAAIQAAARPDGFIEIDNDPEGKFEIRTNGELVQGQFMLLQEAKGAIAGKGANEALQGNTGESASGRAVLARQQGGMVSIASLQDRLHDFTRRVYEHMWMRVRQFWNDERWVRVTDDERNLRFVGLNQPITLQMKLQQMPEEQVRAIAQRLQLVPGDPRLQMAVGVENQVAEISVDIIIEEVPDRVTLQGESFEALLRYAQTGAIPPQVLIEADPSLPASRKEKLLEMLQNQQPTPDQAIDLEKKKAAAAKDAAQAMKYQAEAQSSGLGIPAAVG